jgi:hypothetical protein
MTSHRHFEHNLSLQQVAISRYFSLHFMNMFNPGTGVYVQKSSALVWGVLLTLSLARLASASTPSNDDFATRAVLLGSNGVMQGALTNATRELGEPLHAVYGESGSLWWTWTAQTDSSIEIKILPGFQISKIAQVVAVYRGDNLNNLEEVVSESGIFWRPLQFRVTAGETYQIVACDLAGLARPVALSLEEIPLPINDNFENRLALTAGELVLAVCFLASLEPGEPVNEYGLNRSLWWTWTAPADGLITFSTEDWTSVRVYSGNALSDLVERSYLGYRVQAGEVIQVRSDEGRRPADPATGHIGFRLNFLAAPTNDLFAFRTPLSGLPVEVSGNNALATTDTNKPPRSAYIPPGSVWFEWTAPRTTRVSVWIQAGGTPHVTAFTGNSFSTLKPMGGLGRREEPITFLARQGRKYIIAVGSIYESGSFTLRILPPPPNDLFNDAAELTGVYAEAEGYTSGASVEAHEPRLDPTATRESIWWKWRAPLSGLAIVKMDGDYLPPFAIFDGNGLASLRRVPILSSSVGDFGYSTASFNAASGTVYRIAATGYRFYDGTMIDEVNGRVSIEVAVSTLQIISPAPGSVFSPGALVSGNVRAAFPDTAPPLIDIAVYTAAGQEVARTSASAPEYQFTFTNLPIGRLYLIAGGTSAVPPPVFSPALPIRIPPANDDFAQRALVPHLPALISGNLAGSSLEPAEPPRPAAAVESLWWTWTSPSNGIVRLVSYRTVEIFRGESLASLRLVKAITGQGTFDVKAGQTYHFRSSGTELEACYASLGWLPVNDNFADRVRLTGTNLIIEANNSGATTEPGEPHPGGFVGGSSLWWSWTAPQNGTLLLTRTNIQGTSFLAVFRGAKLTELERLYADDTEDSPPVQVPVQAGVSYQIALHATGSGQANPPVTIHLHFVQDSPNDNFADALPLTGTQLSFGGANYNATRETGEPIRIVYHVRPYGQHPVNATLWWRWTAPTNGIVTISTVPGDFHPFVEMFEGNDLLSLQSLIPANLMYFIIPGSIDFPVESGHEYRISAGGIDNVRGEFQLLLQAP